MLYAVFPFFFFEKPVSPPGIYKKTRLQHTLRTNLPLLLPGRRRWPCSVSLRPCIPRRVTCGRLKGKEVRRTFSNMMSARSGCCFDVWVEMDRTTTIDVATPNLYTNRRSSSNKQCRWVVQTVTTECAMIALISERALSIRCGPELCSILYRSNSHTAYSAAHSKRAAPSTNRESFFPFHFRERGREKKGNISVLHAGTFVFPQLNAIVMPLVSPVIRTSLLPNLLIVSYTSVWALAAHACLAVFTATI